MYSIIKAGGSCWRFKIPSNLSSTERYWRRKSAIEAEKGKQDEYVAMIAEIKVKLNGALDADDTKPAVKSAYELLQHEQ